ncbi:hypothetical protein LCGC14_2062590 [marine sediment metagenome]|uniref:N-acetyltransferase domain-containing protein n=1 Tax=marine sediment metagenome TaxID=412755 RepID=A0A0F9EKL9_9ZZZZ
MIDIRPASPGDAETIMEFQRRMCMETEGEPLNFHTITPGVRAVFDDPAKGQYWLAEVDGQIAGSLLLMPEWSDWRNGTVLWIHSVYVREQFRRQGIFRALYTHLKQMVQADDSLQGLRLYVKTDNHAAMQTYVAMGMDDQHYQMYEWLK